MTPTELTLTPLLAGLAFPEGPRWHEGALWFSDMHDACVKRIGADGTVTVVVEVPGQPSGLGWTPDGALWIVSMIDRRLLEWRGRELVTVADLAPLAPFHCNDMVVSREGRAYIGNFGFDYEARETPRPTELIAVEPDGHARVVADELWFPNGMALTPDGSTLFVGETMANRVTAFAVDHAGNLSSRREFAALAPATADGLCLDAAGALWVASPTTREVLRVEEGGRITHRVRTEEQALACMLGGPAGRTLYVASGTVRRAAKTRVLRAGRIECVEVEVGRAGLP